MGIEEQSTPAAEEDFDADGKFVELPDDGFPASESNAISSPSLYLHPPFVAPAQTAAFVRPQGRTWSASGWFALAISLGLHGAIVLIGIIFFVRFVPPRWHFEKGDGTSTSDYAASSNEASTGQAKLPTAPAIGAPDPNAKLGRKPQQSDEQLLTRTPEVFVSNTPPEQEQLQTDPVLFGISPSNPLNEPPPLRPKSTPTPAPSAPTEQSTGNSIAAPTAPQVSDKAQQAAATLVAKPHVWTSIHPAGAGGSGSRAGSRNGYDERGLPIPDYPAESYRRGEEGLVVLEVEVRADGSVYAVTVLDDAGYPRLAAAAVEAVRTRAHFNPATYDGEPTIAKLKLPYKFILTSRR